MVQDIGFCWWTSPRIYPQKANPAEGRCVLGRGLCRQSGGKELAGSGFGEPWENGDVASWFCGTSQDEFRELWMLIVQPDILINILDHWKKHHIVICLLDFMMNYPRIIKHGWPQPTIAMFAKLEGNHPMTHWKSARSCRCTRNSRCRGRTTLAPSWKTLARIRFCNRVVLKYPGSQELWFSEILIHNSIIFNLYIYILTIHILVSGTFPVPGWLFLVSWLTLHTKVWPLQDCDPKW